MKKVVLIILLACSLMACGKKEEKVVEVSNNTDSVILKAKNIEIEVVNDEETGFGEWESKKGIESYATDDAVVYYCNTVQIIIDYVPIDSVEGGEALKGIKDVKKIEPVVKEMRKRYESFNDPDLKTIDIKVSDYGDWKWLDYTALRNSNNMYSRLLQTMYDEKAYFIRFDFINKDDMKYIKDIKINYNDDTIRSEVVTN